MNGKWLTSFMQVAHEGSITSAAKKLFISPQALLQQINLLEDEIGVPLFSRSKRGVSLTLAGKEFYSGTEKILSAYSDTVTRCRLADKAEETIRIPMMSSIVLPDFMETVCSEYQRTDGAYNIEFISDEFGNYFEGLMNLKYDIIEHFTVDKICPEGIHFESLDPVQTWCIMSKHHPLARRGSLKPDDFEGCTLLSPGDNFNLMSYIQLYMEGRKVKTEVVEIGNDRYQIMDGINLGGIYLANRQIAAIFFGFTGIPLDFDTHVWHGLACREDMTERYRPFFNIAHEVKRRG